MSQASIPAALGEAVDKAVEAVGRDRTRLLDILHEIHAQFRCADDDAIDAIAAALKMPRVEVESVVEFYSFFSKTKKGNIVIRLCDDVIDRLKGYDAVREAFEKGLGIKLGETTADGRWTLEATACIGFSDQAPAALINEVPVTRLTPGKVEGLLYDLKQHLDPKKLVQVTGEGNNGHPLIHSMSINNIQKRGMVIFTENTVNGRGLRQALEMGPERVIQEVREAGLRGHGGAGFRTGLKWQFTRDAKGGEKYVFCNADEGEPGTFKDRVVLTERPDLVMEGLTIAGFACGAKQGIVYLRGEYAYLKPWLEDVLARRRQAKLLGKDILGKGFDFDIRIQLGAGAYICGEETALLSSCEGKGGIPKTRPPFPTQEGFLGKPTAVNNVETLACATRIMENGPRWFANQGTIGSRGTRLLSVSGDCSNPGIYEVTFGTSLREVLRLAGGEDAIAVQVGGASGRLVAPMVFDRKIDYDDLPTGGSIMVFGPGRDIVKIVHHYMEFYVHESCGFCVPCRVGNVLVKQKLEKVLAGEAEEGDLDELTELCATVAANSRCGLGQSSTNSVMRSLRNFRQYYLAKLKRSEGKPLIRFDVSAALQEAAAAQGRPSTHFGGGF